jgi:hypothetical protein
MTRRILSLCLLAAPLALAACGTPYDVVHMPDGRYRTSNAAEADAYCHDDHNGMRAHMYGLAPGNVNFYFDCVPNN